MPTTLFKRIREKIRNDKDRTCRICSDSLCEMGDKWIKPCGCRGSILWVHHNCLKKWMEYSSGTKCTTCGQNYKINKIKENNSKLSKFLFNNKFIYTLSSYLLLIIYFTFYQFSMFWNQKYKGHFFNWFYIIRGICVLSILFYIAFYFLSKKINEKLVEDVESPNLILEDDNLFLSSFIYIPIDIFKILVKIFSKENELSDIEILNIN